MRTYIRVGAIMFYKDKLITTRMRKGDSVYHVLPGGGVEDNETILEAIKREVKEELNLKIVNLRLVYIRELNLGDKGRGMELYFYVDTYKGIPKKGFDPEIKDALLEEIDFLDLDELTSLVFHPKQLIGVLKEDKEANFNEIRHLGLHNYP
ncbi:MAG: NUDIX hydrolase [Candidatus Pacearchaeota archaeon]|nr:NUDIX hydrolase [Candidatus Pacearchaeota archaeon]